MSNKDKSIDRKAIARRCRARSLELSIKAVLEEVTNLEKDLEPTSALYHVTVQYSKYLKRELNNL